MKKIITVVFAMFAITAFAEQKAPPMFSSVAECKTFASNSINEHKDKATLDLMIALGIPVEAESMLTHQAQFIDQAKSEGSKCLYVDEIGTSSLGSFVTRVGYILKYKKGTIFYEVVIGRKSESEYFVVTFNFKGNSDANKLLKEIPEYYWK